MYPDTDIHVNDRPIRLFDNARAVYDDYALQSFSKISIYSNIKKLLANTEFRQAAREVLGSLNLIEIKVRGRDGQVLVRDPNSPFSEFTLIKFKPTENVREIANRTQEAYQRFQDSRPSSFDSFPRSTSSPLRERHFVHESGPFPQFQERLETLEHENFELRSKLENLGLERDLEKTHQLLEEAKKILAQVVKKTKNLEKHLASFKRPLIE